MRALFSKLLDLLYLPKCVFCRRLLRPEEHDVCARCAHELEPIPAPLRRGQFYTECYAVYPYEGVVAESLRRFKFSGQSQYAASFGRMLAPLLRTAPFEVLTWVPVSAKRRRSRGYDQTELLAPWRRSWSFPARRRCRKFATIPRSRPSGTPPRGAPMCSALTAPFLPNALQDAVSC